MTSPLGDNLNIPSLSFSLSPASPVGSSLPTQGPAEPVRRLPVVADPETTDTRYVLARPLLPAPAQVSYPPQVEVSSPVVQPYVYVEPASPGLVQAASDRLYYVMDPVENTKGYVKISSPPVDYYRVSRSGESETEEDPLLLVGIKSGKDGKEVQKVLIDPDNGLVVSKSNDGASVRRMKRSVGDSTDEDGGDKTKDEKTKEEQGDPNGHSHLGNDQV